MPRFLLSILLVAASSTIARGQRGIDDQVFKPAMDSYGIFGTESARTSHQYDFGFLFYFDYAANPLHLKLYTSDGRFPDTKVVDSTATFHLGAHMGITDHIELAFDMPMTKTSLNPSGFGLPGYATANNVSTGFFQVDPTTNLRPPEVAPGDMRWALKVNAWRGGPLALGAAVIATLPFGDETEFLGSSSYTVEPLAIADLRLGRVGVALNAGYRWHDGKDIVLDPTIVAANRRVAQSGNGMLMTTPVTLTESDEIVGSAAGIVHFNPYVSGAAQVMLLQNINAPSLNGKPSEIIGDGVIDVLAGVLVHPLADFTVSLGGGLGVQKNARQEDFTVVAGLAWAPEGEGSGGLVLGGDRDHDGVPDSQDLCPDEPEDRDGFEDADGCPDPDNDQDGIPDAQDRCPNEPEDRDGFQDADGCPDPDNDADGIPDIQDKCPNEPEDRDGFQDEDGCPDPDNDGDGIPDAQDKCPNEPETFNGIDDEDGCPDFAIGNKFTFSITEKILFGERSAKIEGAMTKTLDEVAAKLKRNPQVKGVRIEGHTDNAGNAAFQQHISQQRADAVREYLIRKGIEGGRLQSVGYGAKRPMDTNSTKDGRAKNRRVELIVVAEGP